MLAVAPPRRIRVAKSGGNGAAAGSGSGSDNDRDDHDRDDADDHADADADADADDATLLAYAAACAGGVGVAPGDAVRLAAAFGVTGVKAGWSGRAAFATFSSWAARCGLHDKVADLAKDMRRAVAAAIAADTEEACNIAHDFAPTPGKWSQARAPGRAVGPGTVRFRSRDDVCNLSSADSSLTDSLSKKGSRDLSRDLSKAVASSAAAVEADGGVRRATSPAQPGKSRDGVGGVVATAARSTSHPFEIPFADIEFKRKIGEGAFAEVWEGSWLHSPVAVKKFRVSIGLPDVESAASNGLQELMGAQPVSASHERLARYASRMLCDDDAGRLSRSVTQTALRKFLSDDSHANYTAFLQEVSLMNRLRHPNLVMYMGAVVNPQSPLCIVSELFEGGSLHSYLHKDADFRPNAKEALRIAMCISRGMHYLHSRGETPFLHRDLKPRNVLMKSATSDDPHVVICDFGLCKLFGDDDKAEQASAEKCATNVMGTVSYMSPNVIEGGAFTTADDVYSFGIVLWETFTGRVPYDGMRPIQVMFNVAEDGERPEFTEDDDILPGVRELITECWHEAPSRRPTFEMITRRLSKALEKFPETERPKDSPAEA